MRVTSFRVVVAVAIGASTAIAVGPASATSSSSSCPAVDFVFARGTDEPAGFGVPGGATFAGLQALVPGVTGYAVDYPARLTQLSTIQGARDLTAHVTAVAADCPSTRFVLGGYSQGADALDLAIGVFPPLGLDGTLNAVVPPLGTTIPDSVAPRVSAVVVFGNPYGLLGGSIERDSGPYGRVARSWCNTGDPICSPLVVGNGVPSPAAHVAYVTNGSASAAASFAADEVRASD